MTGTRRMLSAELMAIGTELTVGETRDTNGGDLARELTALGVTVTRLAGLRDDLADVTEAFRDALRRADLVVSTGGLGPTPDDLTREAIAAACDETPVVDPGLAAWLQDLFARRGTVMPERNLKQAWLIPSASALANPNGTAPGWWVDRPDGRVIVALPGPPREIGPMWREHVLPRLAERGAGTEVAVQVVRITGLGESHIAEALGEAILTVQNPVVATYAKADGVDVRISARAQNGRAAGEIAETTRELVERCVERAGGRVFGHGTDTWIDALGRRLAGRRVACLEIGTGGTLSELLGEAEWLVHGEVEPLDGPAARPDGDLLAAIRRVRRHGDAEVGLAVRARERGADTAVEIAVVIGGERRAARSSVASRTAFLGGAMGRRRAAVAAVAELWQRLQP